MIQGRRLVMREALHVELEPFEQDEAALQPGDLLVRTIVTAISPGTELASFTGLAMQSDTTNYGKFPFRPGYAAVGEVIGTGPGEPRYPIGAVVLHSGGHATAAIARTGASVVPVPVDVPPEDAVFARLASISITALRLSTAEPGDTVAVVGEGMIGNFATQLFRIAGMRVLAVDPNEKRLAIAEACGADERLTSIAQIREATGGRGAETVVDATGLPEPIAAAVDVIARFGELILLGTPRGQPHSPIDFTHFVSRAHELSIRIQGAHGTTAPQRDGSGPPRLPVRHSIETNVRYILDLMRPGGPVPRLWISPLRTHILDPSQASDAYHGLYRSPDEYLGVAFRWSDIPR